MTMAWIAFAFLAGILIALSILLWRRWGAPWRDLEELVEAVVNNRSPRAFLISANEHAHRIGLALEKLAQQESERERRMEVAEKSLETILGAMPDGLLVVDDRRRVQLTSAKVIDLFGKAASTPGRPLIELVRDAAADRLVDESMRTGESRNSALAITRGAGQTVNLEMSAVPLPGNPGQARGAVVLFRDMTHLREMEEMRRDFVANVSHELRTPLSIFRGYLETLLEDPRQPPNELVRILEVMERHSDRLNSLVEDVLSLAGLEAAEPRLEIAQIDLADFLRTIARDWEKRFAAKKLRVDVDIAKELPLLHADEDRLQEIVYNLLDNAVKYSQPGGEVHIRAQARNGEMAIEISDAGIGISADDLPHIFERFYRADKARSRELGGTGLGLSIVKHIAQLHGGSVEAESTVGQGTTIRVRLPLVEASKASAVTQT
jgi:two-component system, OmpR family, phosphate regulon sensor histidine kinase PhoR